MNIILGFPNSETQQKSFQTLSMNDFHNINAVNTPIEIENTDKCCPNGNSTTGHSAIC